MRQLKGIAFFILTICLSACSFGYEVVIVNKSDKPIDVRYKITEKGQFDEPMIKTIEEWNERKGIRRLWSEAPPWQPLPESLVETVAGERVIKVQPGCVVRIEKGIYNPISEREGDLTDILELRIISARGEVSLKGRLLLNQFEKDNYTFIKTYTDEPSNPN